MSTVRLAVLILVLISPFAAGFYLPGVAPTEYEDHAPVELKVNKLTSVKTQLPFEYYTFPFCKPRNIENAAENLGEILMGDRIENSDYDLLMRYEQSCKILCRATYTNSELQQFKDLIDQDYRVNWLVDNLPAATVSQEGNKVTTTYEKGFPVGTKRSENGQELYTLNNHVKMVIRYHRSDDGSFLGSRVVGFEIEPFSVQHRTLNDGWDSEHPDKNHLSTCNANRLVMGDQNPQLLELGGERDVDIVFTYDVSWRESDEKWASRWDHYLAMGDDNIHWFSIINSMMIVLFLTGMVAMIMMRTLHRDIRRYNEITQDDPQEETGWKLVHGDVYRTPQYPMLLSVYVGSGVQVFAMTVVTLIFACLGFLSPANRGGLLTAMLLLFVFMGVFAGYYSARLYKFFKGEQWKQATLLTAFMFPGVCFGIFFFLNFFVWGERSSGAVPFGTMFALLVLWFGISVPLVFLGSFFGFKKKEEFKPPVATNQIPRQIPEQAWYMQPIFSILVGGILPFGAVFIELFFIMSSIWLHQFYYVFGFLFLVMVILVLTCAEISIVMCYFQLCSEDYHWWWRSYLTSGSSALYLFAYSALYFSTRLEMTKFVSGLLYFGYMFLISYAFFIVTGTIGFVACFVFVEKIYASVKVD